MRRATRLLQFARYPVPGRVKTRLAPALGEADTLRLHTQLVVHTNRILSSFPSASVELWYASEEPVTAEDPFLADIFACARRRQGEGDLGQRMLDACRRALARPGVARVMLVGSDCPFIDSDVLQQGLDWLQDGVDLVLGPACDGGYYLIGMSRPLPAVFDNITWGGPDVLSQTLARAAASGLECRLLKELPDIDFPADIPKLYIWRDYAWLKSKNIF